MQGAQRPGWVLRTGVSPLPIQIPPWEGRLSSFVVGLHVQPKGRSTPLAHQDQVRTPGSVCLRRTLRCACNRQTCAVGALSASMRSRAWAAEAAAATAAQARMRPGSGFRTSGPLQGLCTAGSPRASPCLQFWQRNSSGLCKSKWRGFSVLDPPGPPVDVPNWGLPAGVHVSHHTSLNC